MDRLVFAVAVAILALGCTWYFGYRRVLVTGSMLLLWSMPAPRTLFHIGTADTGPLQHVGMAGVIPIFTTTSVFILIAFSVALINRPDWSTLLFSPLAAYLLIGMWLWWPSGLMYWAGVLAWLVGIAAYSLGATVGRISERPEYTTLLLDTALVVCITQTTIGILQVTGVPILLPDATLDSSLAGRASGTIGHPGNLAQAMLFMLALALVFALDKRSAIKRRAIATASLATIALVLTGGRAAILGGLILIIGVLGLGLAVGRIRFRATLPEILGVSLAVVIGGFGYSVFAGRDASDPAGGQRDHFLAVAHEYLHNVLIVGAGPNGYVQYFGQFDALTKLGWPVHNSLLFTIGEIGMIGLGLVLIPLLLMWLLSTVGHVSAYSSRGDRARVALIFPFALYATATTGWGLISSPILPILMFTFGLLFRPTPRLRLRPHAKHGTAPVSTRIPIHADQRRTHAHP